MSTLMSIGRRDAEREVEKILAAWMQAGLLSED
jgi:hypothetical protein